MEINILLEEEFANCPEVLWLEQIVTDILEAQNVPDNAEVSLVVTSQERIRELNKAYRDLDETTDVLSFFMTGPGSQEKEPSPFISPPDGLLHLGEVIISCPQAEIQAKEHGHSVKKEVAVLAIHGMLHLLGFDHAEPNQTAEMQAREKAILEIIAPRI